MLASKTSNTAWTHWPAVALVASVLLAACAGSEEARREKPPDQRYGHRYEQTGPEGRRTLRITAPRAASGEYGFYDATVTDVIVRAAPFEEGTDSTEVELLVRGALPNSCLALHEATQERDGNFVYASLRMRWPLGSSADCERFERPYRFYLPLGGGFAPGDYTLKFNGTAHPFSIRRE